MKYHETLKAERLAAEWHRVWAGLSLLSVTFGVAAFLWHRFGEAEHRSEIRRLEGARDGRR
jgi:hypothetical protein